MTQLGELLRCRQGLLAFIEVALEHHADQGIIPRQALREHIQHHFALAAVVLAGIGVAAIDHQARRQASAFQLTPAGGHRGGVIVGLAMAAAQHHMGMRVARGLDQRRTSAVIHAEMAMPMRRRPDGLHGDLDASISAILEAHRTAEAGGHLAMDLRLGGAGADGRPAEQVFQVGGGQRLQQLRRHRQAQLVDLAHQLACLTQAGGHVIAAIQMRIIGQPLPAHRGARLLDIDTHHQLEAITYLRLDHRQALGVLTRGLEIMDGARPDHHQQTIIVAGENGVDLIAMLANLAGQVGVHRQLLAQFAGAGQGFTTDASGCGRCLGGIRAGHGGVLGSQGVNSGVGSVRVGGQHAFKAGVHGLLSCDEASAPSRNIHSDRQGLRESSPRCCSPCPAVTAERGRTPLNRQRQ